MYLINNKFIQIIHEKILSKGRGRITVRGGDGRNRRCGDGKWWCSLSLYLSLFYEMSNEKMKQRASFIRECPTEYAVGIFKIFEFFLHSTQGQNFLIFLISDRIFCPKFQQNPNSVGISTDSFVGKFKIF